MNIIVKKCMWGRGGGEYVWDGNNNKKGGNYELVKGWKKTAYWMKNKIIPFKQ